MTYPYTKWLIPNTILDNSGKGSGDILRKKEGILTEISSLKYIKFTPKRQKQLCKYLF